MKIREYVYCVKCSSDITWNANDPNWNIIKKD